MSRADTTTVPLPATAGTDQRMTWVDIAKGACITLVVLHHAVMFLRPHGLAPAPLTQLDLALTALRMPLFFLASGLFMAPVLERSWGRVLHRRVALFGWLYVLWAILQFGLLRMLPVGSTSEIAIVAPSQLATLLVLPDSSMWFLYALALFSVLARLLRRVPAPVMLAATGALSALIGAGVIEFPLHQWELVARYAFFFVLGWHGRRLVTRLAGLSSLPLALVATAAAAGLAGLAVALRLEHVPGMSLAVNAIAVGWGVLVSAELARWRAGRLLALLGRRTLPIYLANVPVLAVGTALLAGSRVPGPLQYALVALVVAAAVATTLAVHRLLTACRCDWLYDLPGRWAVRPAVA